MTTPPTPAGWYPDPDGSGGQRYWDGSGWTERSSADPAATPEPEPQAAQPPVADEPSWWPPELPPWPTDMEMPSWEKAASEEPTAVVKLPESASAAEAEPEPDAEEATAVVQLPEQATFTPPHPDPGPLSTSLGPPPFEPPAEPVAFAPTADDGGGGNLLKIYLGAVAALLVILIAVLVYAFVIHEPGTTRRGSSGASSSASTTESAEATATAPETSVTATPAAGDAVDGDVTITQRGIEIGPTVVSTDNELLQKTAAGGFVVVHLTLTNNGAAPATFVAELQKLTAGGQVYTPDPEATFYLGGAMAVVNPGEPADVSIAFDVPPGSVPETLEVHGDLLSAGAVLALT